MDIDFSKIKEIKQVKEDINLLMFNSKDYSVDDMINFNNIVEELRNVKISIRYN